MRCNGCTRARKAVLRECLSEKERAACIHRDATVETFRCDIEQVATRHHRNARIVYEAVDLTIEGGFNGTQRCRMGVDVGEVGYRCDRMCAGLLNLTNGVVQFIRRDRIGQCNVETGATELDRDCATDAAPASRDKGNRAGAHNEAPFAIRSRAIIVRWIWFVPS